MGEEPWSAFANGSRIVCIGIITELIAFTILFVVQLIFGVMSEPGPRKSATSPTGSVHQALTGLSIIGIVLGTGVVAAGRTEQAKILPNKMGKGSHITVLVVSWVGVVGGVLAVVILIAGFVDGPPTGTRGADMLSLMLLGAIGACICRWAADAGTVINLGLVSGIMPSRPLRDRVASVNVAGQIVTLCYLGMIALIYFKRSEPIPGRNPGDRLLAGVMVGVIVYMIYFIYAILHLTLNSVAGREGELWEPGRVE